MEKLLVDIDVQINLLNQVINQKPEEVRVHYFLGEKKEDHVRQSYLLYSLVRAFVLTGRGNKDLVVDRLRALTEIVRQQLIKDRANVELICAWLYILQSSTLFYQRELSQEEISFLESLDFFRIYSHPTNIFNLILFVESQNLDSQSFLSSIKNECYKVLDFLLFTNTIQNFPFFSIANANYIPESEGITSLLRSLKDYLLKNLESNMNISSSGLAKCLEFLSLQIGDTKYLQERIFGVLNKRKSDSHFLIRPEDALCQGLYFETDNSAHMCIDTNSHLLNYYLNLYKKGI